jgi:protein-tyrosine phosphatase
MRLRGIDISGLRGRRITPADFDKFDLILAMDRANRDALLKLAPRDEHRNKVHLLMDYAPNLSVHEIPDPFFGQSKCFDYVCQLVDAACRGLLVSLTAKPHVQATATSASRPYESAKG